MRVDQIAVEWQLAHALRQELPERDDDAEVGAEAAQRLDERRLADLFGAQHRNAAALGEFGDGRLRRLLAASARPVGLRHDRHDAVRLLGPADDADDPAAGITVPVPYVIYGGRAPVRITVR